MKKLTWAEISFAQKRYLVFLGLLTVLGMMLLSLGGQSTSESTAAPLAEENTMTAQKTEEAKLEAILSQVAGAGEVRVQISYKSMEETTYATNHKRRYEEKTDGSSEESEETIALYNSGQGSERALIVSQKMPEIAGILIVAEGAGLAADKREVAKAAAVLFDIPEYRVSVLKMKGGDR